jgi:hypothetical protein
MRTNKKKDCFPGGKKREYDLGFRTFARREAPLTGDFEARLVLLLTTPMEPSDVVLSSGTHLIDSPLELPPWLLGMDPVLPKCMLAPMKNMLFAVSPCRNTHSPGSIIVSFRHSARRPRQSGSSWSKSAIRRTTRKALRLSLRLCSRLCCTSSIHTCFRQSVAEGRLSGSVVSIMRMRSRAPTWRIRLLQWHMQPSHSQFGGVTRRLVHWHTQMCAGMASSSQLCKVHSQISDRSEKAGMIFARGKCSSASRRNCRRKRDEIQ